MLGLNSDAHTLHMCFSSHHRSQITDRTSHIPCVGVKRGDRVLPYLHELEGGRENNIVTEVAPNERLLPR